MNDIRTLLSLFIVLGIITISMGALPRESAPPENVVTLPSKAVPETSPASAAAAATVPDPITPEPAAPEPAPEPLKPASEEVVARPDTLLVPQDLYTYPPLPFDVVNRDARAALVNIFCIPHGGSLRPTSGSGVIIDPKGIILTNAHVAQYVLLSESPYVDLQCSVRTGSPAVARYTPEVIAISAAWVADHAQEIRQRDSQGTGEHDWALLRLVPLETSPNPVPLPAVFPSITLEMRPLLPFLGESVLGAGYPAEFVGGSIAQTGLYPVSSVSEIDRLLTFSEGTVDLVSIGSVIEAQGGSSGGPVVNAWDKLVGIITTTSAGTSTASRNLRALTLEYINGDVTRETGNDLPSLLAKDPDALRADFMAKEDSLLAPYLRTLTQ